jgi:pyruvate dehydrogenase E2 component (dihydrolipoamide acetyltransferase)
METVFKMPDLSTTDSAIKLVRWLVKPGQPVKRGDPLCEIETDKAASQVESVVTGVLKELRAQAGEMVSVGQELALFETDGASSSTAPPPSPKPSATPPGPSVAPAKTGGLFARNRAAAGAPSVALSSTQQAVGRRLQASKQNIPHFYLQASANADPIVRLRAKSDPKPVWEAFFVSALARVLKDFERIRWRWNDGNISVVSTTDIGVAIDANGDLFVAPIPAAAETPVNDISREIRAAAQKIQSGPAGFGGIRPAAITITNLGASPVESFTAIINPPEVAILAIGKIAPAPVVIDGQIAIQNRVALTLAADHRIINGHYAAQFLAALIREIESF